jgi:TPR repeat protein
MSAADRLALRKRQELAEKLWERADALTDAGRYSRGFRLCKKAAHLGSTSAQILLGSLYSGGTGIPYCRVAALRWYGRAYRQNPGWIAANNIGCVMWAHGQDAEALRWFNIAISHGDVEPHLQIAKMYLESEADRNKALPHLRAIVNAKVFADVCEASHEKATALLAEHFPND